MQACSPIRGVLGTNASFRRVALLETGYNGKFGPMRHSLTNRREWDELGEETELSLRIRAKTGKVIVYNPNLIVFHHVPRFKARIPYVTQRAFQVGRTKRAIAKLGLYGKADSIRPESRLLGRILAGIVGPRRFKTRVQDQLHAAFIAVICILFVGLGYISG